MLTVGAALYRGTTVAADRRPAAVPVASDLSILPRSAWTDRPPTGPIGAEDVRFLLVHHTAGGSPSASDVPNELRSIYDFHTGPEKGWPDVCYNFFVDPFGTVWEGRAGSLAGPVEASATGGSQGFAQLVCLLGDFTSALPSEAALDSLGRTLAWLADRYLIDTDPSATTSFISRGSNKWPAGEEVIASTICGHRDMSATACPGDTFYPYLVGEVRPKVHALRTAAVVPPTVALVPTTPPNIATSVPPKPAPTSTSTTLTSRSTTTVSAAADESSSSVPDRPESTSPPETVPRAVADAGNSNGEGGGRRIAAIAGTLVVVSGGLGWVVKQRSRRGESNEQANFGVPDDVLPGKAPQE